MINRAKFAVRHLIYFCNRFAMTTHSSKITHAARFFEHYEAAWPITPIIKQMLASSSKSYKLAIKHLEDTHDIPVPPKSSSKLKKVRAVDTSNSESSSSFGNSDIESDLNADTGRQVS